MSDKVIIQPLLPPPSRLSHARSAVYDRVIKLLQKDQRGLKTVYPSDQGVDEVEQIHITEKSQPKLQAGVYTVCQIDQLLTGAKEIAMLVGTDHELQTANEHSETFFTGYPKGNSLYITLSKGCAAVLTETCASFVIKKLLKESTRVICFDLHQVLLLLFNQYGLTPEGLCFLDVKLAGYLLSPDNPPSSLEELLRNYDSISLPQKVQSRVCWELSRLGPLMVALYHILQEKCLWNVFVNLEMKIAPIIAAMEYTGLSVDTDKVIFYSDALRDKLRSLESEAHALLGHNFSLTSTAQLRDVLFGELQLDLKCQHSLHKTSVHKLTSTSEGVLNQLKSYHPLPGLILQHRQLSKFKSFVDSLLSSSHGKYLTPNWLPVGTATGRVSCSNPNMQAFPKQACHLCVSGVFRSKEVTVDVRAAIVSRNSTSFVVLDFKSIELRLLAHFSDDASLCHILTQQSSVDVFQLLASQWFGLRPESVTGTEREKAKRTVYAIIYGIGKERLGENLQISSEAAQELIKSFLNKFPAVQNLVQAILDECRRKNYCLTLCGRRRWFPNINSINYQMKTSSERQAVNFVIQGSAADICKIAMLRIFNALKDISPSTKLLLQIHDELLYEVPDGDVPLVSNKLKEIIESPYLLEGYCNSLKVPLAVRISSGKNWSELQPLFT